MARRRNHYREANPDEVEARPIDEELERRVRHGGLRKRIIAAQGRVMAALGDRRHLYLRLEELVGHRQGEREEAIFNIGFDQGLVRGRADALATVLRNQGARGRALATRLAQLATNAGLEPSRTLAALLEVAWAMALGPGKPPVRAGRRSAQ
jgi:hypothetical protein